jgi:hypothetical protein
MNANKIIVSVGYTGHDPYHGEFAPETPAGTVKRKAMHQFGLEESAGDQYVLAFQGTHLDDHTKLGDLRRSPLDLVLLLKKPQEKGHGR